MRENSRYHEAENHTGQDNSHTLVIEGRNAVLEAFRSGICWFLFDVMD